MSVGDFVDRRPSSDELVDLHISIVPIEHWIERLNYASFKVIGDTFSVGFIRVQPEANIRSIRSDISRQLGEDILPKNYVFLKHVGRCLALVREKQELQLKVKSFLPPLNAMPEIFVLPGMPSMYTYTVLPPIKPQSVDSPNQEVRSQNETEYSTPKITQNNRTTKETNHQYNRQRNGQIPLDNGYENNVQNSPERESVVRKQRHVSGKSAYTRESIPIRQPTHPGQSKDQREFLENGHVNQNENTPMGAKSIVHEGPTQKQVHYSMPNSPYSDDDEDHNEGYSLNPKHPSTPSHSNTVSTDLPIVMSASPAPVPQLTHRPPHSEHSSVIHTNLQKSGLNNYGNEHTSGQASPDHDQTPPPHSHVVVNHAQSHSDKTNGYMPASHMTSPGQFSKLSDRHSERPAHNSIHDSENMAEHISIISHGSNGSDKSSKRRRFIQSAIRNHSTNDAPRDGDGDAPADQIYSPEVARLQTNKSHEHYDNKSENNNESYPPQHSNTNPLTSPHDATQNPSQIPLTSKLTPKPDLDSSEPLSPHDLLYPQYPELQIPHNTPVTVPSANPSSKGSKRSEVKETSIEAIRTEENEQVINSQRSPPRDHGNDNIGDKTPRDQMHDSPEAIRIPQFSKPPTDSPLDHLPNVHTENYSPSKKATSPAPKKTPIANNRTKDLRSSSPSRRTGTPEKAALWEELQRIREGRRQSEETRQDLVRRAKHATSQIAQKRTSARDQWKKQYFNEKKRTAPLEELCNRVRSQLDSSHQRLLTSLAEESNQKVSLIIGPIGNRNKPSLQSNNKIRVSKLQHELDSIRRQVQDAKVKLSGEIKLRHQAEQDVKSMREDLLRKKIASHVAYRKVARGNTLFARSKRSVRAFN